MTDRAAAPLALAGRTLHGRTAVVTGAAGGLGAAIARRLSADGARLVLVDIDVEGAEAAARDLPSAIAVRADLSDRRSIDDAVASIRRAGLNVDILVNNAGLQHISAVHEFPDDRWDLLLAVLLTAPFQLAKALLPGMYARGWGRVVNIGSIHSLVASPNKAAYVAAKHGLLGLTRAIALEAGPHGVTANAICPGFARTPLLEGQLGDLARTEGLAVDQVEARLIHGGLSVKRLIEPAEVAAYASWLCSDDASMVTGTAQVIDGGWTAR